MGYWDGTDIPFYYGLARDVPAVRPLVLLGARADVPEPAVPHGRHRGRHRQHRRPTALARAAAAERHDLRPARRARHHVDELLHRPAGGVAVIPEPCTANAEQHRQDVEPVPHRRGRGHAAVGLARRPELRTSSPRRTRRTSATASAFAAAIINAVMHGPAWEKTAAHLDLRRARRLLRPRAAAAPRSSPTTSRPRSTCRPTSPAAYDRYGFRVPAVIVSPYAKQQLRVARGARPHVDPEAHRDEVEPAARSPTATRTPTTCSTRSTSSKPAFLEAADAARARRSLRRSTSTTPRPRPTTAPPGIPAARSRRRARSFPRARPRTSESVRPNVWCRR